MDCVSPVETQFNSCDLRTSFSPVSGEGPQALHICPLDLKSQCKALQTTFIFPSSWRQSDHGRVRCSFMSRRWLRKRRPENHDDGEGDESQPRFNTSFKTRETLNEVDENHFALKCPRPWFWSETLSHKFLYTTVTGWRLKTIRMIQSVNTSAQCPYLLFPWLYTYLEKCVN